LSACETGLGESDVSDGIYGLQRAFKMAGAERILMSLWEVPDKETAEYMQLLYANWLDTNDLHSAYQNTQKEMREKYPNEPRKWAGFVLSD
jgi:CHAT domain-containing protein